MEEWKTFIGYNGIPRITINNEVCTPIARLSVYNGWASDPEVKEKTIRNANLIAAAPAMYNALLKVKQVMDLEIDGSIELYDAVQKAIDAAKPSEL